MTPRGRSAVALVRLSGRDALSLAQELCPSGAEWIDRRSTLRRVMARGHLLDEALVVWMRGPHSYTGEDVIELSLHGNPLVVDRVIEHCVDLGARLARPGEFTRRAVIHGRLTAIEAEGIATRIESASWAGIAALDEQRQRLSVEFLEIKNVLLDVASTIEASLDHPGEGIEFAEDRELVAELRGIRTQLEAVADTWRGSRVRLHGATVALVGCVNAGKSSLFNALLGQARALVSPVPGTTRDVVAETADWEGLGVRLVDTAGWGDTSDLVERAGMVLGRRWVEEADLRLLVVDLAAAPSAAVHELFSAVSEPRLVVGTHIDQVVVSSLVADYAVSSVTGQGVSALRDGIRRVLQPDASSVGRSVLFTQRQHDLCRETLRHVGLAVDALEGMAGGAVAAHELVLALSVQAELTGEDVRESVLDRLFDRFCIGK